MRFGSATITGDVTYNPSVLKKLFAEAVGTFTLVFAGTGAIVINDATGGTIGHVGISLTFGLVVMALIYAVGDVSGAHLNPAVTFGFWSAGRLGARAALRYAASQVIGAIAASTTLHILFPADTKLGATLPRGSAFQSFALELLMTWLLMFVILSVSTGVKEKGVTTGIAVGAVVGLEAMFGGTISGASMNPARSLGPALVSGHLEHLWIYIFAPAVGALLAMPTCRAVREKGCCSKAAQACST